jgi:hypothetical protein
MTTHPLPTPVDHTVCFELSVRPGSDELRWHAWLRAAADGEVLGFDSPMQLLLHLTQLTRPESGRDGLR